MALINVENLSVHFFTLRGVAKAVSNISFGIEKNDTLGLIGESGCGKTTTAMGLLRMVQEPGKIVSGKVNLDGKDLVTLSDEDMRLCRGKEIAIVWQQAQNCLNPVLTVGKQIVEMVLQHEDVSKETAWARARNQLNLVGINEDLIKCYPHEFSGGMKQRAIVAIATACNPKFIILDEPTTGLDVIVQRQVLTLINDLKKELALTALLISHDLAVIAETCEKVAVMYAGRIVEHGDAVSVFQNPLHPYSKALLASCPDLAGAKKRLTSIPGAPPGLIDAPPGCQFADRCEKTMEICRTTEPAVTEKNGTRVACHLIK